MTPKKLPQSELDIFRSQLENIIDMRHPMVLLAQRIDWDAMTGSFGKYYCEKGRPALPTRLLVGLHLIKHMEGLSDEQVCAAWVVNPYQQYFCGYAVFQHKLVLDRSSMVSTASCRGHDEPRATLAQAGGCRTA